MYRKKWKKKLDEDTFRWIIMQAASENMPGRKPRGSSHRNRMFWIRQWAKEALNSLAILARIWPEGQLNQVFTKENMRYLFWALLEEPLDPKGMLEPNGKLEPKEKLKAAATKEPIMKIIFEGHNGKTMELDEEAKLSRRERLLPICYDIISRMDYPSLAARITPKPLYKAIKEEGGPLCGLRAVYYASLFDEGKTKKRGIS